MRSIHWPIHGDRDVFQRALFLHAVIGVTAILAAALTTITVIPGVLATMVPLTVALVLLELLWSHSRAQSSARRAEIVNSFAGLTVLHHGHAIRVLPVDPLIAEHDTRRGAAAAAMTLGGWAVIVRAYDRYYVLLGDRTASVRTPVAFRTSAVADVVPALADEAISA